MTKTKGSHMSRFTEHNTQSEFIRAMIQQKVALDALESIKGADVAKDYAHSTMHVYSEALQGNYQVNKHHLKLPQYRYLTIASIIACEEYLAQFESPKKEVSVVAMPEFETEADYQMVYQHDIQRYVMPPTKDKFFVGIFTND